MGGKASNRGRGAGETPASTGPRHSTSGGALIPRPLSSGRQVRLHPGAGPGSDLLQIIAPNGEAEVEIVLTAEGPVVRVRGGELRMESSRSIDLQAAGPVRITAEELRVRTTRSVHLNGETIRLNCDEDGNPVVPQALPAPAAPHGSGDGTPCCGDHPPGHND
jgi:hypothetical protein